MLKEMKVESHRYEALDGVRGLAAVFVMLYHYASRNGLAWFSGSWAAVDVFFMLSGFVIMHSYGKKIESGLPFKQFILIRLVRLWPLFAIGMLIGVVAILFHIAKHPHHADFVSLLSASILNIFFIPYFSFTQSEQGKLFSSGIIFPINDPAWSLFFELFVNVLFFAYLRYCKKLKLIYIVLISYVVMSVAYYVYKSQNPGWDAATFLLGFPRVIAEFFMGVLIYKIHRRINHIPPLFALIMTMIFLMLFWSGNIRFSWTFFLLLTPIFIALYSRVEVNSAGKVLCRYLGNLSYPLYVLHIPLYCLMTELAFFSGQLSPAKLIFMSLISLMISLYLITIDTSLRRQLSSFLAAARY
jgi:peptidoglycan/LPS O-acetylase OafA/YrhL